MVFTLNGETGKSVSQYAKEWLKLVGSTKKIIRGNKNLSASDVLVRAAGPDAATYYVTATASLKQTLMQASVWL